MAEYEMKISQTTSEGKVTNVTITNINPEATNGTLVAFAEKLTELTTSTYNKSDKITTMNLDTEGGGALPVPTLTLNQTSATLAEIVAALRDTGNGATFRVAGTYSGDGALYATVNMPVSTFVTIGVAKNNTSETGRITLVAAGDADSFNQAGTITVGAFATENYQAPEPVTFTITA